MCLILFFWRFDELFIETFCYFNKVGTIILNFTKRVTSYIQFVYFTEWVSPYSQYPYDTEWVSPSSQYPYDTEWETFIANTHIYRMSTPYSQYPYDTEWVIPDSQYPYDTKWVTPYLKKLFLQNK